MRPRDQSEATRIDRELTNYHRQVRPLEGILDAAHKTALLEQLLESIHRVDYISRIVARDISPLRADPSSELFDPIKAAALTQRQGDHNEACWLIFLYAHFGKNLRSGYGLTRSVYGRLGHPPYWRWSQIEGDPEAFRRWLGASYAALRASGHAFGNHRKYITLKPDHRGGTGEAFVTYVNWVKSYGNHEALFSAVADMALHDRRRSFGALYKMMDSVASFGRLGKLDYLCMIGKLGLAEIEPGSTFMTGATGPLDGARLLFGLGSNDASPREIDDWLVELEARLQLPMGMQVLEDALCNWQKSPARFTPFRG